MLRESHCADQNAEKKEAPILVATLPEKIAVAVVAENESEASALLHEAEDSLCHKKAE